MPPAVILAAGRGSRLCSDGDPPKPLMRLLGLTLLERSIRTAQSAGVREIVVVVGYRGDEVAGHVRSIVSQAGVRLRVAESHAWRLGNGASALASELHVDDRFFVLMGDHVYPREFLSRLVSDDDGRRAVALVVDRDIETVPDLAEATKVRLAGDRITALGKTLTVFDGADTGVFLCRPAIFDALREEAGSGRYAVGDAVQLLASRGQASWSPAEGLFWQDVDTPADLAFARRRLAVRSFERLPHPPI
jgi:CDP-L-myo-inositol myo-inositolphosphotransferase